MKLILKLILLLTFILFTIILFAENKPIPADKEANAKEWIKKQPLEFVENKGQYTYTNGQMANNVLFKTSFGNCDIYVTTEGLSYVFVKFEEEKKGSKENNKENKFDDNKETNKKAWYYRLDMKFEGAKIDKTKIIKELEGNQGHYNYFYPHCSDGIYGVNAYGKITIKNIYNGIDWVIYTNKNSKENPLKYDFVVHPGADFKEIKIKYINAQSTSLLDSDTKLKIQTIAGNIEEGNLHSYLTDGIKTQEVKSKYIITNDSTIAFEIEEYNKTKILIIDPLVWATYYGGNQDDGFTSVCVDNFDNLYITGYTGSTNIPLLQLTGAYWQPIFGGNLDGLILKFNKHGVRQWATYYGGDLNEFPSSIGVDSNDDLYVCGLTAASNFPVQQLAGAYFQPNNASQGNWDLFILKFNNQGIRQWATYYGGSGYDFANIHQGNYLTIDSHDNIMLTGFTESTDFPTQQMPGAYWQSANPGDRSGFILKFNNQGVRQWATYYGGSAIDEVYSICTDHHDNIYLVGVTVSSDFPVQQLAGAYWQEDYTEYAGDIFIIKFNNLGERQWATFYGGNDNDVAISVCTDSLENVYITGYTNSIDFPIQQLNGAYWQANIQGLGFDVFILKFNNQGVRKWATFYGGSDSEYPASICCDQQNNIYITGLTQSVDFPIMEKSCESFQVMHAGLNDVFIIMFDNQDTVQWATYYGTAHEDFGTNICIDSDNSIYFIGESVGNGFHTVDKGYGAYYDNSWNGSDDSYILKTSPVSFTELNPIICQGEVFTVGSHIYQTSGIYMDTLASVSSCDSVILTNLLIKPLPMLNLGSDTVICNGQIIDLKIDSCYTNYLWQDGSLNNCFIVSEAGIYWVLVNNDGCVNSDTITVTVEGNCNTNQVFYIPNIFSPNDDGNNDVLYVRGENIIELHFAVYNRWGNKVFECDDISQGWDGTQNGKKCEIGVYVYVAKFTFKDGEMIIRNGNVSLVR